MKEITVINDHIVRKGDKFFTSVECRPRNPKARCENCAFDDCSNLEFSDPVFCNARERVDNTNIVWKPMTREETQEEINKREKSLADIQELLESAKEGSQEAIDAEDILRWSRLVIGLEKQINIYKSELAKMK